MRLGRSGLQSHLKRAHPDLQTTKNTLQISRVGAQGSAGAEDDGDQEQQKSGGGASRRSVIWKYFSQIDKDRMSCDLCGKEFNRNKSAGTSGFRRHLQRRHPEVNMGDEADLGGDGNLNQNFIGTAETGAGAVKSQVSDDQDAWLEDDLAYDLAAEPHVDMHDDDDEEMEYKPTIVKGAVTVKAHVPGGRRSAIWTVFEKIDEDNIQCTLCGHGMRLTGAKSTTNALRHIKVKHPDSLDERYFNEEDEEEELPGAKGGRVKQSVVWQFFNRLTEEAVQCNLCEHQMNHMKGKSSTSNLLRHLKANHADDLEAANEDTNDDAADSFRDDYGGSVTPKGGRSKPSVAWHFFQRLNDEETKCSLCGHEVFHLKGRSSTSNMLRHLKTNHESEMTAKEAELEADETLEPLPPLPFRAPKERRDSSERRGYHKSKRSVVWHFFTRVNDFEIECNLCQMRYKPSHGTTSGALRHLKWNHAEDLAAREEAIAEDEDGGPSPTGDGPSEHLSAEYRSVKKEGRKSVVWMFFKRLTEETVECSLCQLEMNLAKGQSTSQALRHLRAHHPKDLEDGEEAAARAEENEYEDIDAEEEYYEPDLAEMPGEEIVEEATTTSDQSVVYYYYSEDGTETIQPGQAPAGATGAGGVVHAGQEGAAPAGDRGIKRSVVWDFFHRVSDNAVECIFCQHTLIVYKGKSTSNALRHMKRNHPKQLAERQASETGIKIEAGDHVVMMRRRGRPPNSADRDPNSIVWKIFTDLNPGQMQCKMCDQIVTRDASGPNASALTHMRRAHVNSLLDALPEEEAEWVRAERAPGHEKRARAADAVVQHFFVAVDEERTQCALCDKLVEQKVVRLRNHLRLMHPLEMNAKIEEAEEAETEAKAAAASIGGDMDLTDSPTKRGRPKRSVAWMFFDEAEDGGGVCKTCGKQAGNKSGSTTALIQHLR
jgi:hypothetical protein